MNINKTSSYDAQAKVNIIISFFCCYEIWGLLLLTSCKNH